MQLLLLIVGSYSFLTTLIRRLLRCLYGTLHLFMLTFLNVEKGSLSNGHAQSFGEVNSFCCWFLTNNVCSTRWYIKSKWPGESLYRTILLYLRGKEMDVLISAFCLLFVGIAMLQNLTCVCRLYECYLMEFAVVIINISIHGYHQPICLLIK